MKNFNRPSSDYKRRCFFDKSFSIMLCMLGIRLNLRTKQSTCRRLCTPLSLVLHTSLIYCWNTLLGQLEFTRIKLHGFTFICCTLSIALWYHMLLSTRRFKLFLGVLRKRGITLHDSRVRNISRIAVATAILFPVFLTTVLIIPIRTLSIDWYVSLWLWGYRNRENPAMEFTLLYLGMFSFYFLKFTIPSLAVALFVILNLRLSEAVREQTRRVEDAVKEGRRSLGEEIEKYQAIVDCCERYRDCSKGAMLILCALYFTMTYTGLGVVFYKQSDLEIMAILESVFTISGSVFSVVNLLGFGSGIPDAMGYAANRFQVLFRGVLLRKRDDMMSSDLMLLKSVGEIKPVYLTAGDLMRVRKSLILTSFGCTITYCLLIMQMNPIRGHPDPVLTI